MARMIELRGSQVKWKKRLNSFMKSINISMRDFDAFLALAQTQHFTRAAEQCHLSQSAFSQKIGRIEASAGVLLFERSTRHVTLTPEGEVFAEEVRRIQADMRQAFSGLQDLAHRRVGRVAVAALPSVAAEWMPQVIARYAKTNPQIKIELFDTLAGPALSMLREGRADMAITSGEDLREFECVVLRLEKFFFICRDDHPLAGKTSVTLLQAIGADMIHLARSSSVRQHLQSQPAMLSAPPHSLEVEHLATLAALVAQGLGVSVVPELTLFHFRRERLKAIPIRDRQLRRPIVLARHKARALSIAAKAMFDEVVAQART
ncbi:LysR family transcriptional regulator [Hydrogenophaga sp.]|uniref:LysR family transcriptional regulator n=1 Tax=Hydrogenophaga sp. TaxID=1904254 RepID=UPI00272F63BE|nr:LysR family transcriptional regulator [Hydrogenophaga sp.]MDP2073912.1 LysR family transcriptional regulator [Hydrogenophaga sp.]MDP3107370.1 LysR family transcriptional regulator [Hydrogenophaga sp.]